MKRKTKNIRKVKDDSLYGLLLSYKSNYTYFRILVSNDNDAIALQMTDNPKNFNSSLKDQYTHYRILSRLEIGITKMSLKYVTPENLIAVLGPLLEINIPSDMAAVSNNINKNGTYVLVTNLKYKTKIVQAVKKLINMNSHKRYEIVEKYLSRNRE